MQGEMWSYTVTVSYNSLRLVLVMPLVCLSLSACSQENTSPPAVGDRFRELNKHVVSGGPPKDGIPAVDRPQLTTAEEGGTWLLPDDVVFGVAEGDFIAAFPQRILVWHEIANFDVDGRKLSVTYCPLTGTAIGYEGVVGGIPTTFGVSGKLVNSNLIMYDRATDSLWPQILGEAIRGPQAGDKLKTFPIVWTTWAKWKARYPGTRVLSRETGFLRDYGPEGDPYGSYLAEERGYYASDTVIFPLLHEDNRLSPKMIVVGMRDAEGNTAVVRKDVLREQKSIEVPIGQRKVLLTYDPALHSSMAVDSVTGNPVHAIDAFWFAWYAFFPDTLLIP